ncbi:MAG: nucleoside kinase [bacterium]
MKKSVTIYCKNNNCYKEYQMGTSLLEIYNDMQINLPFKALAARVNYKVQSLNFVIYKPKDIEFIDASSDSGHRVYLRSLSMIMAKALSQLMPNATLHLEHPICNGIYCCINERENKISQETIDAIKLKMQEIIAADQPIISEEKQTPAVVDIFRKQGSMDKVVLLETLGIQYSRFFRIGNFVDYYNGVLAPSTGYLPIFDIKSYNGNMVLLAPDRQNPNALVEFREEPKMFEIFNEFVRWNKLMCLRNVGDFNNMNRDSSIHNMIKISEALHEKKIAQIADMILERQPDSRFVMISGPSSSGKTTLSKRLSIQLMVAGLKPIALSLDNYFVNRVDTPLDENGEWDFEALNATDLELLNDNLSRMLKGEEVEVPFYNFESGQREWRGEKIKIEEDNVIILEGIHALNPDLCRSIPQNTMFKIYASALTTISLDNHNWIATDDTRLLRRIVRDSKFRNYSARETINRWPSVKRGETKWIIPFQENADVMFNSALIFELAVLRKHAEPILDDVPQFCNEYTEAHRLLKFLKYFNPIHEHEIPPTSLLREFLGGSSFKY